MMTARMMMSDVVEMGGRWTQKLIFQRKKGKHKIGWVVPVKKKFVHLPGGQRDV